MDGLLDQLVTTAPSVGVLLIWVKYLTMQLKEARDDNKQLLQAILTLTTNEESADIVADTSPVVPRA